MSGTQSALNLVHLSLRNTDFVVVVFVVVVEVSVWVIISPNQPATGGAGAGRVLTDRPGQGQCPCGRQCGAYILTSQILKRQAVGYLLHFCVSTKDSGNSHQLIQNPLKSQS